MYSVLVPSHVGCASDVESVEAVAEQGRDASHHMLEVLVLRV